MEEESKIVKKIPLPDARTAYQLRCVKDRVYGTTYAWDIIQKEYWPVFKLMEDHEKANDRNGIFIHWVMDAIPGDDAGSMRFRNEIHRRVDLSFLDPDRKQARAAWSNEDYFDGLDGGSSIIWAKDVVEREIEWLWPGRIPLGKQTTFAGPGAVGKSFLLCDVAARVSAGLEWPFSGGELAKPGSVLYVSGEDDVDDTLRPRLRLQGADLGRVAFLSPNELLGFNLSGPRFRDVADRAIEDMGGASLIIIDPPSSFLDKIDENSNAEVRGILTPMKEWAFANKAAIILNSHINKASGKKLDVQMRVMGSVAWVNGPRMAHLVTPSEDDPDIKLFVPLKCNVWSRLKALSFRIVPDLHEVKHARLEWIGEVDVDAGVAINGRDEDDDKRSSALEAERWVIEQFREKANWSSKDLMEKAAEELGDEQVSAVKKARTKLGIKVQQLDRKWICWVPENWEYGK